MDLGLHRALPVVGFGLNILLLVVALVADRRDPRNRAFAGFTAASLPWTTKSLILSLTWGLRLGTPKMRCVLVSFSVKSWAASPSQ